MRCWISALALSVCAFPALIAASNAATCTAGLTGSTGCQSTSFDFWWYSDAALTTFLGGAHPGVNIITPSGQPDSLAPTIRAKGYTLMGGLGGYAAQWAQGYPSASEVAAIEQQIDIVAAEGGTMIYVNEPWPAPNDPSETGTSAMSIAYNVKGFNILYNYIHSKHPGLQFGLVIGDDGGAPLHLSMLRAGLHEDFSAEEEYNSCCQTGSPWVAQKAEYPNVKTMTLAYNTESLCQHGSPSWIDPADVDIIGFWDLDNYGGWIGPWMDASWLQNAETFASTGQKPFCALPASYVNPDYWTWATKTANFTLGVWDVFWYYETPQPDALGTCDWMVMSGSGGINGPSDPSMKVTLPWTPRACNGTITVTIGLDGYCRDVGQKTCLVFTRAHTTTGLVGNVTYQEYSIDY